MAELLDMHPQTVRTRIQHEAKSQTTPENIAGVQAAVYRIEVMKDDINVEAPKAQKTHTWLSKT